MDWPSASLAATHRAVRLVVVRHGEAEAEPPWGLDDAHRALTPRARLELPEHFGRLRTSLGSVDEVWTSPLVRAVQTSTLLAQALAFTGRLAVHPALLPAPDAAGLVQAWNEAGVDRLVAVGHQPALGLAVSTLLGHSRWGRMAPGTVVCLDGSMQPGGCTLMGCFSVDRPEERLHG